MKCHVHFKHLDHSESLVDYTQERLLRLEKYEWKPVSVSLILSKQKHLIKAELSAVTADATFQSSVKAGDYYLAVDQVVDKLGRQLARKKSKIQHHKHRLSGHHAKHTNIMAMLQEDEDDSTDISRAG